MRKTISSLAIVVLLSATETAQSRQGTVPLRPVTLDSTTKLAMTNGRVLWVDYRGRRALKLAPLAGHERDVDQEMVALLSESDFKDGVIEVDVAGARRSG